jgi:tetratricopeptide (TPR) repeat protein
MAEAALRLDPQDPEALELRGSLRVDMFRQGYGGDGAELARLAEEDLRAAAAADESRAFAHVSLADLLRLQGDFSEASIAAQHALDADPFLINAEKEVLFMLSQTWLDVGDLARAGQWIDAGRSRFPAEPSFSAAKLVLLAGSGGMVGAVDTAYVLLDQMERVFHTPVWTFGRLQVAAVLAQHGMADSARVLVAQGRGTESTHPFLDYFEANVRLHLGQEDRALDLLEEFLTAMPIRRKYIAQDWWWEPLRDHPRFQGFVEEASGSSD